MTYSVTPEADAPPRIMMTPWPQTAGVFPHDTIICPDCGAEFPRGQMVDRKDEDSGTWEGGLAYAIHYHSVHLGAD